MLPILTAKEMAMADMAAIEELRTEQTRLMELAGRETARHIAVHLGQESSLDGVQCLVMCGKGNNGGDGFVAARHLLNLGATVDVVLLWPETELAGINSGGLAILKAYRRYSEELRIFTSLNEASLYMAERKYAVIVDAVLGTGLKLETGMQPLRSPEREAVGLINELADTTGSFVAAIDIPSGLDATTGLKSDPCIHADLTVTMAFLKTGFFLNDGPAASGTVQVAEISIPRFLVEPCNCLLVDESFAAESYQLRLPSGAKHNNGKVLVIAGSSGPAGSMLGAAMLAAKAAVKTGAGYVCVSLPEGYESIMHGFAPEVIVTGRNMESLLEKARWADALVIGCGLGRDETSLDLVEMLLAHPDIAGSKLVLDADALYAIARRNLLDDRPDRFTDALLTPHAGECSRLTGLTAEAIQRAPIDTAKSLAEAWNVNILLKGNPTIVASPAGNVLLGNSGTEALSTAGTGDVLAGMIGALAAKGLDTLEAGAAAAWLHGRAGDLACNVSSLVSSVDVLEAIPLAVQELFETREI